MDREEAEERARRHAEWREGVEATLAKADAALAAERPRPAAQDWRLPVRDAPPLPGYQCPPRAAASDPVPPLRRPAGVPRDWDAERKWIESIIDKRFEQVQGPIIGQCMGEFNREERAITKSATEALAEEVGTDVRNLERRIERLETEIKVLRENPIDRLEKLQASLDRMNSLLDRIDQVGRREFGIEPPPAQKPH